MAETKNKTKKKPSIKDVIKPSKGSPITEKKEDEESIEEMKAELARLRAERKARGGRPKKSVKEKASVRVSFYITPTQREAIDALEERGSVNIIAKRHLLALIDHKEADDEDE